MLILLLYLSTKKCDRQFDHLKRVALPLKLRAFSFVCKISIMLKF